MRRRKFGPKSRPEKEEETRKKEKKKKIQDLV